MDVDTCEQRSGRPELSGGYNRVNITGVFKDELGYVWNDAKPMLERALAPNETIEAVLTRLFTGSMQLWVAFEGETLVAALTTEIITEGNRHLCNIAHLGGSGLNNWLYYLPTIEAWAKSQNCTAVKIARARMGWLRILKGYKPRTITLEKEL